MFDSLLIENQLTCELNLQVSSVFLAGPKGQAQGMQLSLPISLPPSPTRSLPEADILNFSARILKLGVYSPLVTYI